MSLPDSPALTPVDPLKREYWCFISYRHADNKKAGRQWATWLHQALETYEVPADLIGSTNQRGDVLPERIFPVFRDEEELPADAHLSTPIDAALRGSRFLVVLCSPQAVQSTFVAEEILRFKQLGKQDRILAAILEGEPNASDSSQESERTAECFPVPLRYHLEPNSQVLSTTLRAEPIAADFRLPDGTQGWTTPGAYREVLQAQRLPEKEIQAHITAYAQQQHLMLLKIVAGVLGVPLGILTKRDQAHQLALQKKRAAVLRRWLMLVGLMAIAAMAAGLVAYQNGQEAQAQRDVAARRSTELSQTLGSSYFKQGSAALQDARTARQGLAYLARAVREHQHPTAAVRLLTFLQQRTLWQVTPADAVAEPKVQPPTAPPSDAQAAAKLPAAFVAPKIPDNTEPGKVGLIVGGPRGLTAVSWREDTDSEEGSNHSGAGLQHFRVWDASGKPVTEWINAEYEADHWVGDITEMTFSPDGDYLAVRVERWRQPEYLQVWHLPTGKQVGETLIASGSHPNTQGAVFTLVSFTPSRPYGEETVRQLIAGSSRGDATLIAIRQDEGEAPQASTDIVVSHLAPITAAAFFPQSKELESDLFITASDDGEVCFKTPFNEDKGRGSPSLQLDEAVTAILPLPKNPATGAPAAEARPATAHPLLLRSATRSYVATPFEPLVLTQPKVLPKPPAFDPMLDASQRQGVIPEDHAEGAAGSLIDVGGGKVTFPDKVLHAYLQNSPTLLTIHQENGLVRLMAIIGPNVIPLANAEDRLLTLDPASAEPRTLPILGTPVDLCLTLAPENRKLPGASETEVVPLPTAATLLKGARLTVTTKDYLYRALDLDSLQWLSQAIDEKPLFKQGGQASEYVQQWVSPDGRTLLTRSHHWEPPNGALYWTTLWDLPTGAAISDRAFSADENLDGDGDPSLPYLTPQTACLSETDTLLYRAPETLYATLSDLAEVFAHQALTATNDLEPVPLTGTEATLERLKVLRELAKGSGR